MAGCAHTVGLMLKAVANNSPLSFWVNPWLIMMSELLNIMSCSDLTKHLGRCKSLMQHYLGGGRGKKTFLSLGMVTTLAQGLSPDCHHFSKHGLTAAPLALRKATSTIKVSNFLQWNCPSRKLSLALLKAWIFHAGPQCRGIAQHAACLMQMESIQRFRTAIYTPQLGARSVYGRAQIPAHGHLHNHPFLGVAPHSLAAASQDKKLCKPHSF